MIDLMNLKFWIIVNGYKDWAKQTANEVENFIIAKKHTVENKENQDVCIIIGGDGTIFYNKDKIHGAIFAIGGPQSKVCQAKQENWKPMLEKILKKLVVEERAALSAKINDEYVGWAINDIVVHSRKHNFVELAVSFQKQTYEFGGDGVIVSTPTGASGYAYSAGGFVLNKSDFLVEIVPICPYLRKFTPKLVSINADINITCKGAADLILDGQRIIEFEECDKITICGDKTINFVVV
ncbi:MAG: hypothetical protein AB1391_01620 [Candidatus Micrarchaeota archaeon]